MVWLEQSREIMKIKKIHAGKNSWDPVWRILIFVGSREPYPLGIMVM